MAALQVLVKFARISFRTPFGRFHPNKHGAAHTVLHGSKPQKAGPSIAPLTAAERSRLVPGRSRP